MLSSSHVCQARPVSISMLMVIHSDPRILLDLHIARLLKSKWRVDWRDSTPKFSPDDLNFKAVVWSESLVTIGNRWLIAKFMHTSVWCNPHPHHRCRWAYCYVLRMSSASGFKSVFSNHLQTDYKRWVNPANDAWHSSSSLHFGRNSSTEAIWDTVIWVHFIRHSEGVVNLEHETPNPTIPRGLEERHYKPCISNRRLFSPWIVSIAVLNSVLCVNHDDHVRLGIWHLVIPISSNHDLSTWHFLPSILIFSKPFFVKTCGFDHFLFAFVDKLPKLPWTARKYMILNPFDYWVFLQQLFNLGSSCFLSRTFIQHPPLALYCWFLTACFFSLPR